MLINEDWIDSFQFICPRDEAIWFRNAPQCGFTAMVSDSALVRSSPSLRCPAVRSSRSRGGSSLSAPAAAPSPAPPPMWKHPKSRRSLWPLPQTRLWSPPPLRCPEELAPLPPLPLGWTPAAAVALEMAGVLAVCGPHDDGDGGGRWSLWPAGRAQRRDPGTHPSWRTAPDSLGLL